jgi:hypothetical protein
LYVPLYVPVPFHVPAEIDDICALAVHDHEKERKAEIAKLLQRPEQRPTGPHVSTDMYKTGSAALPICNNEQFVAVKTKVLAWVRVAVHELAPRADGASIKRFMYWNPKDRLSCGNMFLLRHGPELEEEIAWTGGREMFLAALAIKIRNTANNERSVQNGVVRRLWLSKANPEYTLCGNVLTGEVDMAAANDVEPPLVSVDIAKLLPTSPTPHEALRALINSPHMYKNGALYDKWAGGFESGMVRGTVKTAAPLPISALITIAHEAHFRLEIYLSLSRQNYSHATGIEESCIRRNLWRQMCSHVTLDRKKHGAKAHTDRLARRARAGIVTLDPSDLPDEDADDDMDEAMFA